jgi:hypothetical protein
MATIAITHSIRSAKISEPNMATSLMLVPPSKHDGKSMVLFIRHTVALLTFEQDKWSEDNKRAT